LDLDGGFLGCGVEEIRLRPNYDAL
jgi:hypothetical protein